MNIDKLKDRLKKETGWFDIYYSESKSYPVKFEHSVLEEVNEYEDSGVGIRLNKNGKTGFSYTNNSELIEKAADKAIELSAFGEKEHLALPGKTDAVNLKHEYWKTFDKKTEIAKGTRAIEIIKEKFPHADVTVQISAGEGSRRLINSEGADYSEEYKYYSSYVSALLVDESGSRLDIGYSDVSTDVFKIDFLAEKIAAELQLASQVCDAASGKVPVIFTPDAFAAMLSIILSGFNAKQIYKKLSPFYGKIGNREFNEKLTITDDPLIINSPSSYTVDDEGVKAGKRNIIKNGVIENIISDVKYASLLNIEPSGNSSRNYGGLPHANFSNLIVEPGTTSFKDLCSRAGNGIIADQFLGLGQSNTLTGDFSANLNLAYLVKNGEIQGRIKDCMVSGNIFEMLKNSIEISSDFVSKGGSIIPYILFENINLTA
ncbi:MAG: TldD/PmbA family protein [Spirochaetes bacterium]|nr:TldD/PmbA family protein [Spirochaetota bacterium]